MRVLIVGGAGYVGGALTDILQEDITVYDNLTFEDEYLKPVKFVQGDVRDHKKLKPLLEKADVVVWLAAIVGDAACQINPELTEEINRDSVKWLAENYNGRIIFMSTCSVYGAQDGLLNEKSPTNPLSLYAATKLQAEEYLEGKNAIIFRLGTLFGIGDTYSRIRLDLVVNTMTAKAVSENKLKVFGGQQYRPLLHVRDAAQTIADSIGSTFTGIYNLHHSNLTMLELAELVQSHTKAKIETEETTFEDSRNYRVDSQKAKFIRFYPNYSVESGIQQVIAVVPRIKDLTNSRYNNYGHLSR